MTARPWAIPPLHEYRFELDPGESLTVKLLTGTAELFGYELAPGNEYPFGDECRGAVFSWHGAEIEVTGRPATEYVASETPLPSWLTLHLALEKLRLRSVPPAHFQPHVPPPHDGAEEAPGPRVMVVGGEGEGKTTLCKTLVNWGVKSGRARREGPGMLLVNLDPSDGGCTVPGTFSIMPVSHPLPTTTPVLPFGSTPTSGPPVPFPLPSRPAASSTTDDPSSSSEDAFAAAANPTVFSPLTDALTFPYLHSSLTRNPVLVEQILKRMGAAMERRVDRGCESACWRGGVVIDTPGAMVAREGRALIKEAVRAFGVNVLAVMGNEKLHLEMTKLLSTNKTVRVVRVPKSGGASEIDAAYRRRLQASQIRSYFYGGPALSQGQLSPFTILVKFEDLIIYRIGSGGEAVPSSALPIGAVRTVKDTSLVRVDPEDPRALGELVNAVLAIPQSSWVKGSKSGSVFGVKGEEKVEDDASEVEGEPSEEEEEVAKGPVLGFAHLMSLDVKSKKYTILSSLPGKLPRRIALVGSIDWMDT